MSLTEIWKAIPSLRRAKHSWRSFGINLRFVRTLTAQGGSGSGSRPWVGNLAQSDFTPRREEKRALQKGKRESCFLCKSKSRTDEALLIFLMANYPTLNFRVTDGFDFICSSFTRISSSPPQFLSGSWESRFWLKKVKSGSDAPLLPCPAHLGGISGKSRGLVFNS